MRAVLDPNVLVSAAISPQGVPAKIVGAWSDERFELVISRAVLDELRDVLLRPSFRRWITAEEAVEYVCGLEMPVSGTSRGTRHPVESAGRPVINKNKTSIRFLDLEELAKLITTSYPDDAWGSIEPTLYLTAAMTGLRQGEALALRWRDFDFQALRIRVVQNYVRGEFNTPKSEDSSRSIPMATRVAEALLDLHERTDFRGPTTSSSATRTSAARSTAPS